MALENTELPASEGRRGRPVPSRPWCSSREWCEPAEDFLMGDPMSDRVDCWSELVKEDLFGTGVVIARGGSIGNFFDRGAAPAGSSPGFSFWKSAEAEAAPEESS